MTAPTSADTGNTVMVRNTRPGPTVFTHNNEVIEWDGAGNPNGGDLQPCPASFLSSVQFRRMSERGILVVVDDAELIADAQQQHLAGWNARMEALRTAGEEAIDQAPNNDSVVKTCIGPSGRGPNLACGADVPIKASKLAEIAPLCTFHESLANQYVAEEGERLIEGKPEIVWKKIQMDSTVRTQD